MAAQWALGDLDDALRVVYLKPLTESILRNTDAAPSLTEDQRFLFDAFLAARLSFLAHGISKTHSTPLADPLLVDSGDLASSVYGVLSTFPSTTEAVRRVVEQKGAEAARRFGDIRKKAGLEKTTARKADQQPPSSSSPEDVLLFLSVNETESGPPPASPYTSGFSAKAIVTPDGALTPTARQSLHSLDAFLAPSGEEEEEEEEATTSVHAALMGIGKKTTTSVVESVHAALVGIGKAEIGKKKKKEEEATADKLQRMMYSHITTYMGYQKEVVLAEVDARLAKKKVTDSERSKIGQKALEKQGSFLSSLREEVGPAARAQMATKLAIARSSSTATPIELMDTLFRLRLLAEALGRGPTAKRGADTGDDPDAKRAKRPPQEIGVRLGKRPNFGVTFTIDETRRATRAFFRNLFKCERGSQCQDTIARFLGTFASLRDELGAALTQDNAEDIVRHLFFEQKGKVLVPRSRPEAIVKAAYDPSILGRAQREGPRAGVASALAFRSLLGNVYAKPDLAKLAGSIASAIAERGPSLGHTPLLRLVSTPTLPEFVSMIEKDPVDDKMVEAVLQTSDPFWKLDEIKAMAESVVKDLLGGFRVSSSDADSSAVSYREGSRWTEMDRNKHVLAFLGGVPIPLGLLRPLRAEDLPTEPGLNLDPPPTTIQVWNPFPDELEKGTLLLYKSLALIVIRAALLLNERAERPSDDGAVQSAMVMFDLMRMYALPK